MHNTNINNLSVHTCPGLQIQIIQILLCSRVRAHTHANVQTNSSMYTTLVFVHPHQHTPTSHTPDVSAYRSIPIHPCTPSLPLSHTHPQAHCLPYCPPSYRISHLCCLRVRLQQCCHHLQPCCVLNCQIRGRLPFCARADSRQCQHTKHAASQQRGQKAVCSCLLPLCESVMHPSCYPCVQHMFVCIWLVRKQLCVCVSERQRKKVYECLYVYRLCGQ